MDVKKISAERLKKLDVRPLGKNILLDAAEIGSESVIEMPDSSPAHSYSKRSVGRSILLASKVGPECEKVKNGDYLIISPRGETLMSFKIDDKDYLSVHEDDVRIILRGEK